MSDAVPSVATRVGRKGDGVRLTSGERDDGTPDCPAWCRRGHDPGDHADDRLHQSEPVFAPVVLGDPRFARDDLGHADSLVLRVVQRADSPTAWLEAVPEEGRSPRLLVSTESARRLADAMTELLGRL
jgi:hypothetical protein